MSIATLTILETPLELCFMVLVVPSIPSSHTFLWKKWERCLFHIILFHGSLTTWSFGPILLDRLLLLLPRLTLLSNLMCYTPTLAHDRVLSFLLSCLHYIQLMVDTTKNLALSSNLQMTPVSVDHYVTVIKISTERKFVILLTGVNKISLNWTLLKQRKLSLIFQLIFNPDPVFIKGEEVERVHSQKYLGIIFNNKLSFSENTSEALKKVLPRSYCLRKLRSFRVQSDILSSFYRAATSSVFFFGVVCWGGSLSERDLDRIEKTIKKATHVTGHRQDTLDTVYHKQLTDNTKNILKDSTHPLVGQFDNRRIERSGRLRLPMTRTIRYKKSFIRRACTHFNNSFRR